MRAKASTHGAAILHSQGHMHGVKGETHREAGEQGQQGAGADEREAPPVRAGGSRSGRKRVDRFARTAQQRDGAQRDGRRIQQHVTHGDARKGGHEIDGTRGGGDHVRKRLPFKHEHNGIRDSGDRRNG